ncbi:hypothetical protein IU470_22205 [Nocardia abscessus]|uniref:HTH luxR-type domain-containing protein n=1 Tax=Nocardia abscessus TaxID=120957 RepID=A0ABS0CE72_9NOCA|nr:NB-ARC domain-containing protein [Nocardia abscessus]MBF6227808.1 hypothetical protein [Nocardia abscessus]
MAEMDFDRSDRSTCSTEFVGRHLELRWIDGLLRSERARLITLMGPGGIGKTRLAAEALRRFRRSPDCSVYWVRLARLAPGTDTDIIAEEVMQSTATVEILGRSAQDCLVDALAGHDPDRIRRVVLVMDNCEHVLDAAASLIAVLLDRVPGLTIIATSREAVGWVDEHILKVRPLSAAHAVELFRRRAELTGQPISDDAERLAVVKQICQHVDNNPLFIRLAAARLRHRPPAIVLRELTGYIDDRRMQWSHGARAGTEERHRGVRDVISWSYGLCTDTEQLLLDRMSVFAASFEAHDNETSTRGTEQDAIIAVCADETLPQEEIESTLERLVERSLVSEYIAPTAVRFFLLESVRVFASGQLRLRSDVLGEAQLLARLRRHYKDKILAGRGNVSETEQREWMQWTTSAWDNIMVGIETGLATIDEAAISIETAIALVSQRAPFVMSYAGSAITTFIERALAVTPKSDKLPTQLRVAAMAHVSHFALWQGRFAYVADLLDECVAACVADPQLRGAWRSAAGSDLGLPADVEFASGLELMLTRCDPRSVQIFDRARRKFAEAGDTAGRQRSELFQALASCNTGDAQQALKAARQHLDRALSDGSADWVMPWAELAWMFALALHGDPREALQVGRAVLKRHGPAIDPWTLTWTLHYNVMALSRILTDLIATGGAHRNELVNLADEVALLGGAVTASFRSMGITVGAFARPTAANLKNTIGVVASVLGQDACANALDRGARMGVHSEDLHRMLMGIRSASDLLNPSTDRQPQNSRWRELSRAEREIAVLVAAGWANSAIAARRGSSIRTVDTQVSIVLRKLMLTTRADVIRHVPNELQKRVQLEARERPIRLHKPVTQPPSDSVGDGIA